MLNELKKIIEEQTKEFTEGSIENALAKLILHLSENSEDVADIILADLRLTEMNITALVKYVTDYARKNKQNGGYCMSETKAIELIKDFYKLPSIDNKVSFPTPPKPKVALNLELSDLF